MSIQKTIRQTALAAHKAGLSLVPPREDGSKAPIGGWGKYQKYRPLLRQIHNWYGAHTGVGLVCGRVSRNLECLEFDDSDVYSAYNGLAKATSLDGLVDKIATGYSEQSPSCGIHWLYRCSPINGNTKPARRIKRPEEMLHPEDKVKTLIETRGEGGYIIIAPSFGTVHPSGKPYLLLQGSLETIATITTEEREALFELARSFDQINRPGALRGNWNRATPLGTRPGDLFNSQGSWTQILIPHGWIPVYQANEETYWRRPGKDQGISATTNYHGSDLLYVFSTSTAFEPERGYSKFSAHALLDHAGDFKAAAWSLSG